MKCSEKEDLQQKCTAGWNAYVAATKESGLAVGTGETVMAPSISELLASGFHVDLKSGKPSVLEPYLAALRLRGEHLKASRALSKHLSQHRC